MAGGGSESGKSDRLSWLIKDKEPDKNCTGSARANIYEKFKLWGLLSASEAEKAER